MLSSLLQVFLSVLLSACVLCFFLSARAGVCCAFHSRFSCSGCYNCFQCFVFIFLFLLIWLVSLSPFLSKCPRREIKSSQKNSATGPFHSVAFHFLLLSHTSGSIFFSVVSWLDLHIFSIGYYFQGKIRTYSKQVRGMDVSLSTGDALLGHLLLLY